MMGGMSPETCWALYKYGIIKFWYTVASCWIFLCELYYDARIHGRQEKGWVLILPNGGLRNIHFGKVINFVFQLNFSKLCWGPGKLSRCSESPLAGRSGYRVLVGARFSIPVQTGPGAYPAPCTMGTGSFSREWSGRGLALTSDPI